MPPGRRAWAAGAEEVEGARAGRSFLNPGPATSGLRRRQWLEREGRLGPGRRWPLRRGLVLEQVQLPSLTSPVRWLCFQATIPPMYLRVPAAAAAAAAAGPRARQS